MQVQFKRPVTIGRETYGKGVHNVPEAEVKDNWFFDALVKEGNAIVLRKDEEQPARLLKPKQRSLPPRRANKLLRLNDGHHTVSHRFSGVRGQCPLP